MFPNWVDAYGQRVCRVAGEVVLFSDMVKKDDIALVYYLKKSDVGDRKRRHGYRCIVKRKNDKGILEGEYVMDSFSVLMLDGPSESEIWNICAMHLWPLAKFASSNA